jgi:hypothetical protein
MSLKKLFVTSEKSEYRSQNTEVRIQKSEYRSQNALADEKQKIAPSRKLSGLAL